ncbi:MAG: hypothetical protein JNL32_07785 [Candidatus Kapabacteria bacterium]|nr:hypothetical protein [Candidatus Kapabacteria bacterium]
MNSQPTMFAPRKTTVSSILRRCIPLCILLSICFTTSDILAQSSWSGGLRVQQPHIFFTGVIRNGAAMVLLRGNAIEIVSFSNGRSSVLRTVKENMTVCGLFNDTTIAVMQSGTIEFISTESGRTLRTLKTDIATIEPLRPDMHLPLVTAARTQNIIYSTRDSLFIISNVNGKILLRERKPVELSGTLNCTPYFFITSIEDGAGRMSVRRIDTLNQPVRTVAAYTTSLCLIDSLIVYKSGDSIIAHNVLSNTTSWTFSKQGNKVVSIIPVQRSATDPQIVVFHFNDSEQSIIFNATTRSVMSPLPHSTGKPIHSVVFDKSGSRWWIGNSIWSRCITDMPMPVNVPNVYAVTHLSGKLVQRYPEGHITGIDRAEFSNDGTRFITSSKNPYDSLNDDNYLWNRTDTTLIRKVSGKFFGFAKNGSSYVMYRNDSLLHVRNDKIEQMIAIMPQPPPPSYVGCSSTTDYIANAFHQAMILHRLKDGTSDIFNTSLLAPGDSILSIHFIPNGQQLMAYTKDRVVMKFTKDWLTMESYSIIEPTAITWDNGKSILWSDDGKRILINNKLYSTQTGEIITNINLASSDLRSTQLSYDGNFLFHGTRSPMVSIPAKFSTYSVATRTEFCFDNFSESANSTCPADVSGWVSGDARNYIGYERYSESAFLNSVCPGVIVSVDGERQPTTQSFTVFPQPASEYITVPSAGSLIDMLGRVRYSTAEAGKLDVSALQAGVYVFRTSHGSSQTICIQR